MRFKIESAKYTAREILQNYSILIDKKYDFTLTAIQKGDVVVDERLDIEISTLEDLWQLRNSLNKDIIFKYNDVLLIYDDYIE